MSYLVLARKWRPRTFDEVVGQSTVTRTLKNALASGRIGHAFLLSGGRGVGKTTTARILAKALNCSRGDGPTAEPCDACSSCQEIAAGSSLDVQEIDGASNNSVDNVRELRESARYNPTRDRFKVWIIDEVHMLSASAFNALLKTLEEPPPRVKFIFATTEYHKLPDTILSRCQQYDFRMIPAREIQAHLRKVAAGEGITVSDDALARIARAAEGSARDALSLFDQVLSFSGTEVRDEDIQALLGLIDRELLLAASGAIARADSLAVLELVERLSDYGSDYRNFTRELLLHLREVLLVKLAPESSALLVALLPEEQARMRPLAAAFSEEDLLRFLDVLTKVEAEMRLAQDPRVTLEVALLKLVQLRRIGPFSELVDRVERLAAGLPAAAPPPRGALPAAVPLPARAVAPLQSPPPRPEPAPAAGHGREQATALDRAAGAAAPVELSPAPAAEGPEALLQAMLAKARPTLAQALRGAQAREESGALVLEVAADWVGLAEAHLDEYGALARQVAARPLKVRLASRPAAAGTPAPASAPAPAAAEDRKQKLIEQATREPAVQEALELFGGRVVDVRDKSSSKEDA